MSTIETSRTTPTTCEAAPVSAPAPAGAEGATARGPGLTTETIALGGLFVAVFAFLAALFAVALAARAVEDAGEASAAAPASASVEVGLMEFMIMPEAVSVPAGTSSLAVVNEGSVEHTLAVEGGAETAVLAAGESAELDVAGLAPGEYRLICTIAGHVESGMEGTLTVG